MSDNILQQIQQIQLLLDDIPTNVVFYTQATLHNIITRDSLNAHIKTIHKGHLTDNRDAFTRASNDYYDETSKQPADKEDVLEREMCLYEDDYEDPITLVDDLRYYIVERRLRIEHHVRRDIIKKLQNMGIIA
ncbi:hypothetical protein NQ318_011840 [Aromia moschata]|uniref:Uncharacterized protein n=1 Tax=Aromia moschata TaxID=1265417 RepID=A0AAV8XED2_9CUCU|nr:hypothetical protein NQ318_011840 [Aromia moschata]